MTGSSTKLLRSIHHIFDIATVLTIHINILGIPFCVADDNEVTDRIRHCIGTRSKLTIVQPHFFHTVLARSDSKILNLYRKYDLILPDGYGVYIASKFLYGKERGFKKISNGTDFYDVLLKEGNYQRWRIFFLGETESAVLALKLRVHNAYPNVVFAGAHHGFINISDGAIVSLINEAKPDILMIGMGTPKQDYWLWRYFHELNVPVSIVVGAGIGFISGIKMRAPATLRKIHMEWLFRLLQEPRRLWRRYLLGIPKFVFYIILQKVRQS